MQSINKCNKGIWYLLCATDLFSKYAWVVPIKDIVNAFQNKLDCSKRKPSKIWFDQGSEFYNNSFKKWLKDNGIEMYSTFNEGNPVVAERFVRVSRNNIYKHMTAVSKNVYFDVFDDFVDEYNNIFYRTIKMKPIYVKSDSYAKTMKILMKKILSLK